MYHIVHYIQPCFAGFQPLVLDAACQQLNISQHRRQDILSSLKGINSPSARRKFTVSESFSCCMDNTCPVTTTLLGGNIRMITWNSPHYYQSPQSHLARATGNSKHKVQIKIDCTQCTLFVHLQIRAYPPANDGRSVNQAAIGPPSTA